MFRRRRNDPTELVALLLALLGIGISTWILINEPDPIDALRRTPPEHSMEE